MKKDKLNKFVNKYKWEFFLGITAVFYGYFSASIIDIPSIEFISLILFTFCISFFSIMVGSEMNENWGKRK